MCLVVRFHQFEEYFFSVHRLLAFARSINTLLHEVNELMQVVIMSAILVKRCAQKSHASGGPDTQSYGSVTMLIQVERTKQKQHKTKATTKQNTQKQKNKPQKPTSLKDTTKT